MKSIFAVAALVASAMAQGVVISAPPPLATLTAGETTVVEVVRPDSLTGSQEVSVAIGIQSCVGRAPAGTCDGVDTSGYIGTSPLYVGPYTPEIVPGGHSAALVQNFTVTVPDYLQPGAAVIAVAHFSLILGVEILFEVVNQTVIIGN
ncbi:hypothetical protein ONZ51_g7048 [Trametes cubensis]|uniref:Uncharacterized protein n=1 Tax=Trametes cubensis TaxID=1111947 RepID=A0AAD7TS22_9APHY|nr:hypothetical protein ONZ51_g7048 [Trametes cubensis]